MTRTPDAIDSELASLGAPHRRNILAPGGHVMADGTAVRVTSGDFCEAVSRAYTAVGGSLPSRLRLFRMAGAVGSIIQGDFRPLTPHGVRILIDTLVEIEQHRVTASVCNVTYIPCSQEWGALFLDYLGNHGTINALRAVVPHPVPGLSPGWNRDAGVYVTFDAEPAPPLPIDDLLDDFALDPVSRANFVALLLTILYRPVLIAPVPLFIVSAPVAGAGKSLLIDALAGFGLYGRAVPSKVWPSDPEEVRKSLTSALVSGSRVLTIDNVPSRLESPSLASFLTAMVWHDRLLGQTLSAEIPTNLTLVVTGNRVEATGELARRSVVIELKPGCDSPEMRRGWKYPDIRAEAARRRPATLAWLFGLVTAHEAAGSPEPPVMVGSFESWSRAVLGPVRHAGLPAMEGWVQASHDLDADRQDAEALVGAWWAARGDSPTTAGDLLALATACGAYEPALAARHNERGQQIVLGIEVRRLVGRVINGLAVTEERNRTGRFYRLASA